MRSAALVCACGAGQPSRVALEPHLAVDGARHRPRHAGAACPAVMVAFWLGCVGPTRVSMLPPMNGSSPGGEAIRPVTTTGNAPQRDSYASHAADESPRAIAEVTIAALLVRLLAGATAPIMFGVFGAFDEDRLFDTPQLAPSPAARPARARGEPRCAAFLCGPITLPR